MRLVSFLYSLLFDKNEFLFKLKVKNGKITL